MPWKLIGCKTYKIIPTKKNYCTIPGRHIYFICGWYRVTIFFFPFPSDIFRFDILWHFQFNIANTLAAELKVHPEEGLNADTSENYNYFFPSNKRLFVNNILYRLRSTEQLYLSLFFLRGMRVWVVSARFPGVDSLLEYWCTMTQCETLPACYPGTMW